MQVCTSLQTNNHASTPPLSFLQAGCPSCHPTNNVKALKANKIQKKSTKTVELVLYPVKCTYISRSLWSASYVGCGRDTARICCWAPCSADARCCRSISLARTALSSKPAARRGRGSVTGQTDRQTDDRFINSVLRSMRLASIMSATTLCGVT